MVITAVPVICLTSSFGPSAGGAAPGPSRAGSDHEQGVATSAADPTSASRRPARARWRLERGGRGTRPRAGPTGRRGDGEQAQHSERAYLDQPGHDACRRTHLFEAERPTQRERT